jgi:hypothetical protein
MIRGKALWDEPTDGARVLSRCAICGHVHRFPGLVWRCSCGWRRCAGEVAKQPAEIADLCPDCGRRMVVQDQAEIHGDDDGEAD